MSEGTPTRTGTEAPALGAEIGENVTRDTLLRGRVRLIQPAQGFRASVDPVLLSGFLSPPYGRFLDVGCGTGALAFLLLARDEAATGLGLELQPRLAKLTALANEENGFNRRFSVRQGDARQVRLPGASFDLVVTNPPFQPLGQGNLPPDEERSIAHHEVALAMADWLDLAARVLRPEGRLGVIHAASRAPELLAEMQRRDLVPQRLRPVYPRAGAEATRVLVEARRGGSARGFTVEPPLYVHDDAGYTPEVRGFLGEEV
jgi:tRNA1(Val) A37 N6-methylase TrmN6